MKGREKEPWCGSPETWQLGYSELGHTGALGKGISFPGLRLSHLCYVGLILNISSLFSPGNSPKRGKGR